MIIFKAEPVVVPKDLAERFDKVTGNEQGFLRNLIADHGNLHVMEEELLAIGLMSMVKGLMEAKNLPDDTKPLTIERLSNVVYVIMFAYCTGTMGIDEDGDFHVGDGIEDVRTAIDVSTSRKIMFANGKIMPTQQFLAELRKIASPDSIGDTYKKIVRGRGLLKSISPQSAFSVAKVSILACKELMSQGK